MTCEELRYSVGRNVTERAPGHYADIVALQGDPLADINVVLKGVRWVMKGGQVVVNRTETASSSSSNVHEASRIKIEATLLHVP